jgi:hypothetical protein
MACEKISWDDTKGVAGERMIFLSAKGEMEK